MRLAMALGTAFVAENGETTKPERKGPLARLPSAPGPHVAMVKVMRDNSWLELPKPDHD